MGDRGGVLYMGEGDVGGLVSIGSDSSSSRINKEVNSLSITDHFLPLP